MSIIPVGTMEYTFCQNYDLLKRDGSGCVKKEKFKPAKGEPGWTFLLDDCVLLLDPCCVNEVAKVSLNAAIAGPSSSSSDTTTKTFNWSISIPQRSLSAFVKIVLCFLTPTVTATVTASFSLVPPWVQSATFAQGSNGSILWNLLDIHHPKGMNVIDLHRSFLYYKCQSKTSTCTTEIQTSKYRLSYISIFILL